MLLQDLAADSVFAKGLQYACEGWQRYGRFATLMASLFVAYSLPFVLNNILKVADVSKNAIAFAKAAANLY